MLSSSLPSSSCCNSLRTSSNSNTVLIWYYAADVRACSESCSLVSLFLLLCLHFLSVVAALHYCPTLMASSLHEPQPQHDPPCWSIVSLARFVPSSSSWLLSSPPSVHHLCLSPFTSASPSPSSRTPTPTPTPTPTSTSPSPPSSSPFPPPLCLPLPAFSLSPSIISPPILRTKSLFASNLHHASSVASYHFRYRRCLHPLIPQILSPASGVSYITLAPQTAITHGSFAQECPVLHSPLPVATKDQQLQIDAISPSLSTPHLSNHASLLASSSSPQPYRDAHLDLPSICSQALEVDAEPPLPTSSSAPSILVAVQGTAVDCPVFQESRGAPMSNFISQASIAIQTKVTPVHNAVCGGDLEMEQAEQVRKTASLKVRARLSKTKRSKLTPASHFFPPTRCPSKAPTLSSSLDFPSNGLEIHNDNSLHRQLCIQNSVACEVEQSSCRGVEDGIGNEKDMVPGPSIPALQGTLNCPPKQSLQQLIGGLDKRTAGVFDNRDSKALVEHVEDILGEIEDPANIDLVAVAEFLALRR